MNRLSQALLLNVYWEWKNREHYESGVLALELTYSCWNKKMIKNNKTFQKHLKLIGDEYVQVLYIRANFCDKITSLLLSAKNKINALKI